MWPSSSRTRTAASSRPIWPWEASSFRVVRASYARSSSAKPTTMTLSGSNAGLLMVPLLDGLTDARVGRARPQPDTRRRRSAYRSRMTQSGRAQPGRALGLSGSTPASPRPAPRAPRRLDLTVDARSVDEQRRRGRDAVGFAKERAPRTSTRRRVARRRAPQGPDPQDRQTRDQAARRGMTRRPGGGPGGHHGRPLKALLRSAARSLLQDGDKLRERFGGGRERVDLLVGHLGQAGAERGAGLRAEVRDGGDPRLGQLDEDDPPVVGTAPDETALLEALDERGHGRLRKPPLRPQPQPRPVLIVHAEHPRHAASLETAAAA